MTFSSTKRFDHSLGLSCCFRQHKAESHCRFLHGYALAFTFIFEAIDDLDERKWVVDFGGLGPLKEQLIHWFDHKTVVAADDPLMDYFRKLHSKGAIQMVVMDHVGCESFAKHAANLAIDWLRMSGWAHRVRVAQVEVAEHGANSAIFRP